MPIITHSIPKNKIDRGNFKFSQDGSVISVPASIAHSASGSNIAAVTRQPDAAGRAVFDIQGVNEGSSVVEIGSGPGKLIVNLTVTAPEVGPVVVELDGAFVRQN